MDRVAQAILGLIVAAMVVPLLVIVGYLVIRAWPLLSWEFLFTNPTDGMRRAASGRRSSARSTWC